MGLTEENISEIIACRDLDAFCAKIGYHPLKIVFDLKQIMYPSRTDMLVYMLWLIVYNNNRTYFIVENNQTQSISTMDQFYTLAGKLPLWMQPEPLHKRRTYVEFASGCKLLAVCNSVNFRGWTASAVMISTDITGKKAQALRHILIPTIVSCHPIIEFNNGAEYTWMTH